MDDTEQEQRSIMLLNHAGYVVECHEEAWTVTHSACRREVLHTHTLQTLVIFADDIQNYQLPREEDPTKT
jgi:hypothetical protein